MTDARPMKRMTRAAKAAREAEDSEEGMLMPAGRVAVCAVLRAIREPDERVLEAMAAALERPTVRMGGASPLAKRQALAIWQAGIDAAMEEWRGRLIAAAPALLDAAERAEQLARASLNDHASYQALLRETEAERDRLAAENIALSEQNASMKAGRRPFNDAMAERTISRQVREIDRLAARVAELEAGLRLSRGLLEAVRDNDPNDMAADAVPVSAVWRSEAQRILALLEPKP